MNELKSSREYRNHLQNVLKSAKLRLTARDYEVMAAGISAEITRLDSQIAELEFSAFMGTSEEPLVPKVMRVVQRVCLRPEPTLTSIGVNFANEYPISREVKRFVQIAKGGSDVRPSCSSTLAMGGILVNA